jgi:hypothetical protein
MALTEVSLHMVFTKRVIVVAAVAVACSSPQNNTPLPTTDVPKSDVRESDAQTPDAQTPDVLESDAQTPDVQTPDVQTPDVQTPDVQVRDVVDAATPDVAADTQSADGSSADVATTDVRDASAVDATDASDAATDRGSDAGPTDAGAPDSGMTRAQELWVLRVGDGMAALSGNATAAFIERRSSIDGSMRGATLPLPIAAAGSNRPLTLAGTSTSEGVLTRSFDGRYVSLAGYGVAPGAMNVASSSAMTAVRVVARVGADGVIDSSTALAGAFSGSNVRGAVTSDGAAFWAFGSSGGVVYQRRGIDTDPVAVLAMPANIRTLNIFNGQLYGAAATGTPAPGFYSVFSVGMGTPTTAGAMATLLPGLPRATGPQPYGFSLVDRDPMVPGVDTLYIAEDRSPMSGGGVQRYTLASGTWSLTATFNQGISSGTRALTTWFDGGDVFIAAVTAENPSRVVAFRDTPGAMPGTASLIAVAPMNTQFRGIALAPMP